MTVNSPPYLSSAVPSTLAVFEVVTVEYVTKLIAASPNKSCDLDPIATSLVKQEAELLAPLINTIINESLKNGDFPQAFKSAIVTPLLKKVSLDPEEFKNYRPVSNLAFVSKLIEKMVVSQLNLYLANNNLSEVFQSAYRKGHSSETAL